MAINEEITGNTSSSTTVSTNDISDIVIEGNNGGKVYLEVMAPSGDWIKITNQTGAFSISTPDTSLTYRFTPVNVVGNVRVFMGP